MILSAVASPTPLSVMSCSLLALLMSIFPAACSAPLSNAALFDAWSFLSFPFAVVCAVTPSESASSAVNRRIPSLFIDSPYIWDSIKESRAGKGGLFTKAGLLLGESAGERRLEQDFLQPSGLHVVDE